MKASPRFVLPLVGALVLTGAVLGTVLWPEPSVSVPVEEPSASPAAGKGPPASRVPRSLPDKPLFSSAQPGPRPPVSEPSKPRGPWAAQGKQERPPGSKTMLMQDMERLEQARDVAAARGDEAERQRLDTVLQHHRYRMQEMREELEALSGQESSELPDR